MAYATINKPTDHFNTKPYTGTGGATSITGVGFQPDFVWIKKRSSTGNHNLTDAIRGVDKIVYSNSGNAESTFAGGLSSFDSDGFSLAGNDTGFNASSVTYASWNWLAGGTGVSNTDGSITSTVSANTTSGFSIVSYTGSGSSPSTVGHGLGEVPKMIFLKNRSVSVDWQVYHQSLGNATKLLLNLTNASSATSNWNSTSPTSSVITINGTGSGAPDASGENIIAYCFAEKKGFSKAFSYTGNASTDGPFIYMGFKPAWVFLVSTGSSGYQRFIWDNKRDTYNVAQNPLAAQDTAAEPVSASGYREIDFLSNGIKIRASLDQLNTNGQQYIGFAFAEAPLVGTNNIPATAR